MILINIYIFNTLMRISIKKNYLFSLKVFCFMDQYNFSNIYNHISFKNNNSLLFIVVFLLAMTCIKCQDKREGSLSSKYKGELYNIIDSQIPTEAKLNQAGIIFATMMEEAVARNNTESMVAHVETFGRTNEEAIRQMGSEMLRWSQFTPDEIKIEMMMKVLAEDYSLSLARTIPLYYQRIESHPQKERFEQILIATLQPLLITR